MEITSQGVWWAGQACKEITAEFFPGKRARGGLFIASPAWWLFIAFAYGAFCVMRFVIWAVLCIAFVLLNCVTAALYGIFAGIYLAVRRIVRAL